MPHRVIGIICTSPGWGGLELNTLKLIGWLSDVGWKVHLLSTAHTPISIHAAEAPSSMSDFGEGTLPGKGGQLRVIHAWVRRYKIPLLFVPYNKDIAIASLYKRFYDRQMVVVYQQHMQVGVRKRDLIHTLRYAMIDAWISPLNYLKQEVIQLTRVPPDKIEVIPFGLETEDFLKRPWTQKTAREKLDLPQHEMIIGVLGRIDPKKGQDLVVQALSQLLSPGDMKYHVLLMGNSTVNEGDVFTNQLHKLVQDLGLQNQVHFRPYTADVLLFFRAIDVFAMPAHGETFGMVTIEAMAAGVPVIGTNKDGTREILEDGRLGYLFEKEDVADFCQKLYTLQQDTGMASRLNEARRVATTLYSKEKMVAHINALLEKLLCL